MTPRPSLLRPALVLAMALAGAPAALAQTASSPTRLSGVTVSARSPTPPAVVSTFPAAGKAVAPGALILKVTFDQRMTPDGWDYAKGAERYPSCLDRPRLLPDEKTFVLLCTVGPNSRFSVAFNATTNGGFENLAGQRATPASVDFATDDGQSLATIADAMKAAGLKPDEGPVMDSRPASALASGAPATPGQ